MIKLLSIVALAATCALAITQEKSCCSAEKMVTAKAQTKVDGKEACCKSTEKKPVAKGDKGCCNAKGEVAKFKVYVAFEGYKFFGCEGSAKKGREELAANGYIVGEVQKVK